LRTVHSRVLQFTVKLRTDSPLNVIQARPVLSSSSEARISWRMRGFVRCNSNILNSSSHPNSFDLSYLRLLILLVSEKIRLSIIGSTYRSMKRESNENKVKALSLWACLGVFGRLWVPRRGRRENPAYGFRRQKVVETSERRNRVARKPRPVI